jgi:hypothetical protein
MRLARRSRLSKLTGDDYQPQAMLGWVRRFNSPSRRTVELRPDTPDDGAKAVIGVPMGAGSFA